MVILGIDPGVATVGFGVVRSHKGKLTLIEYGCITTPPRTLLPARLFSIAEDLQKIIQKYRPDLVSVEELFFFKNKTTALAVAQSRGVILLSAQKQRVPLREFTPLQVKQALVGYGRAEKRQVQHMVKSILKMERIPRPDDAADALAIAICAANLKSPI